MASTGLCSDGHDYWPGTGKHLGGVMSAWKALKADTHRQYGCFRYALLIKGGLTRRTFRPLVTMRLCQAAGNASGIFRLTLTFFKILHRIATQLAAIDLSWNSKVGAGLALTHGWGLVISPGATIGNNVTLFHGVTIGRRDRITAGGVRLTEYPVLEDEVWVGAHAIIIGGVTIGQGSRIAGGAFVTESVPPHSIVSGNPARITKTGCVADVMNRAPLPDHELPPLYP
jgi:serine O-acetyltransferase